MNNEQIWPLLERLARVLFEHGVVGRERERQEQAYGRKRQRAERAERAKRKRAKK